MDSTPVDNTTGDDNAANGFQALFSNTTGSNNIGLGFNAGKNIVAGSKNIEIGSAGAKDESNTIRVGTQGTQTATHVAGVYDTLVRGAEVVVNSNGQLGSVKSSGRYKRDIRPLAERSRGLWRLRPVTFRYRQDPQGEQQHGFIAEEVAKVYPELVVRGDKGEVESVQYYELIPLMLNEMQHQEADLAELKTQYHVQQATLIELKAQNLMLRAALAQQNTVFRARLERLEGTSLGKTLASR
jgi:Chaperone of endosialidase